MTTPPRAAAALLFLLSLAVALSSCGSGGSTSIAVSATYTPAHPTLTPTLTPLPTVGEGPLTCAAPSVLPFPMITYSPTDAQGNFVDSQLQGSMSFKADGSFNRAGTRGCYRIAQQQMMFTDQVNTFNACILRDQVGAYQWTYDGTLLSFTLVNDGCDQRVTTLTQYKWKFMP
jgi:hypothetical protein